MKRTTSAALAGLVALLLTAFFAASASASAFIPNKYFASLSAQPTAPATQYFYSGLTGKAEVITCYKMGGFEEEVEGSTETFGGAFPETTCESDLGSKPVLKPNNCEFIFHTGAEVGTGTFEIGPSNCGSMKLGGTCIYPKAGYPASYSAGGPKENDYVVIGVSGINLVYGSSNPFTGACEGPGAQNNQIQYYGEWRVEAKQLGSSVGVHISNTIPELIGLGSGAEPKFEASYYPVQISGTSKGSPTWKLGNSTYSCTNGSFGSSLSAPSTTLLVTPTFSSCVDNLKSVGNLPATVAMNGCQYYFSINNVMLVGCPAGAAIELLTYTSQANKESGIWVCKTTIGGQLGLKTLDYSGSGGGVVDVAVNVNNLKYTRTKKSFLCGSAEGAQTGGVYEDGTTLTATR